MAEILKDQYNSVFSKPSCKVTEEYINSLFGDDEPLPNQLSTILVTEEDVENAMKLLPNEASPGPDGISTTLYKRGGRRMIEYLTVLFNTSIETGQLDPSMIIAIICPTWKGTDNDKQMPKS